MENLKQLQILSKVINSDKILTEDDVQKVLKSIVEIFSNFKKSTDELNTETRQVVQEFFDTISKEHDKVLKSVENTSQKSISEATEQVNKALEEMKRLCKEVMGSKPENGKDGKDADEEYVIESVLAQIKLPEYKETVLDNGEQIVAKINDLPLSEENQIDASHIKNLPPTILKGGGGVRKLTQLVDTNISSPSNNQVLKYNSTTNQWENGTGGGSGSPGGSNTQLQYNNAGSFGGISGVTTDGTAVTFVTDALLAATLKASGSGGFLLEANNGTDVGLFGAGNTANVEWYGSHNFDTATANTIAIFGASKTLSSADTATYPSLTELSYVKGVTSAIQTQLNGKQATITFGTGVEAALGVNIGSAGAPVLFNGALGTPTSGTVTNLTGTASININGTVGATTPTTGAFTTISASSTITASTTVELGHASDTTLSRVSAGVIAVEGVTVPTISSTNTLTNKRITKRVGTTTSSATPTINTDNVDYYSLTAQTADITSFTTNLSGTPTDAQTLWISITGTAARAITWGSSFESSTVTLPTTTVSTARLDVGFVWNAATSKWRCVAKA